MVLEAGDRLEIGELIADYGHLIDDRDWDRVADLFTDEVVYDVTDFGMGVAVGMDAVVAMWTGPAADHPLAHHASNVVIREDDDGTVHVRSKGIGVGSGGRVGSVDYQDEVEHTPAGWRISRRKATLRRKSP